MKTAALLPTPGDPFHVLYWLRNYERIWIGEVDELRVLVNGQPDAEARACIRRAVERVGGVYDERQERMPHGHALNILIQDTDADVVVLVEDDAMVRRPQAISEGLASILSYGFDVVSSPRQSMSPELQDAAVARWGECVASDGATGHGMWPAFVFARRDALLATDRGYGERAWGTGMTVPGLHHTVTGTTCVVDTFGATAFQLRDSVRVKDLPQFKGPWRWEDWLDCGCDMTWFHIGSLSSSGNLVAEVAEFAEGRTLTDEMELGEWSHRIHWWDRFLRTAGDEYPEGQVRYRANVVRLMERMGVSEDRIRNWDGIVDRVISWDEHA